MPRAHVRAEDIEKENKIYFFFICLLHQTPFQGCSLNSR